MSQDITIASRWDEQYEHGRYANESPIEFVSEILDSLKTNGLDRELGLYLGCGNGRNYIPLRDKNLNILGIDISQSAISALVDLRPKYAQDLQCTSITGFEANHKFAYIIAIQILQHGDSETITSYFDKINELLENNGMLFIRVNSISTEIYHKHTVIKDTDGLTIQYTKGPKRDLLIHFFTKTELEKHITTRDMIIQSIREVSIKQEPPKTGFWYQWELVCKKQPK